MTRFRRRRVNVRRLTPHAWLIRPETNIEWAKRVVTLRGHA